MDLWIKDVERQSMYRKETHLCSENKNANQLRSYCAANLHSRVLPMQITGFLISRSLASFEWHHVKMPMQYRPPYTPHLYSKIGVLRGIPYFYLP